MNVYNTFSLNYHDEVQLKDTVALYAQDWSIFSFIPKCWEALAHLFGCSEWTRAKNNLKERAIHVINSHIGQATDKQAEALSEFVLRNLITPANQWEFVEILDRAPFGNGRTLPEIPRSALEKIYRNERERLKADIKRLEDYLSDLKQQFQPFIGILGDVAARTGKGRQDLQPFPEVAQLLQQTKNETQPVTTNGIKAIREARAKINSVYLKLSSGWI